jgi:hypothetical protein
MLFVYKKAATANQIKPIQALAENALSFTAALGCVVGVGLVVEGVAVWATTDQIMRV